MATDILASCIRRFLQDHLTLQKGCSRHTVLSYRDTIKLLLAFAAARKKTSVSRLTLADLTPDLVVAFLNHLEKVRGNSASTRNIRLACVRSFFRFIADREPLAFEQCRRILVIPFKRASRSTVEHLDREEMGAILEAPDCSSPNGRRDRALFSFMYNTGARVQEVLDLQANAIQLERPYQARILGKGGRERLCPLWPHTVKLLRSLLAQRGLDARANVPIFVNRRGQPLTRSGVRYLLAKYVRIAAERCASLKQKRRIHPHVIRHTTATHLLRAGVDINTIRAWLGHVNLETTNRYAELDLDTKRKVLKQYLPIGKAGGTWKRNGKLLEWLESL